MMEEAISVATTTVLVVSVLSLIDISLTYYLLWWDRRIHPKDSKFTELNVVAALIMRITNYGPWGLLISSIIAQTLIWGGMWILITHSTIIQAIVALSLMMGGLVVVIWMHLFNIARMTKLSKAKNIIVEELNEKTEVVPNTDDVFKL